MLALHRSARRGRVNEAETRAELIDPALQGGGWGVVEASRVRRETICPGRMEGAGRRGKPEIADYVLIFRNHKLAVIEAKRRDLPTPKASGRPRTTPTSCKPASPIRPTAGHLPDRHGDRRGGLCRRAIPRRTNSGPRPSPTPNAWRDRFAAVPFEERGGNWQTRYYQDNAIEQRAGGDRRRQAAHPADARDRHRQDLHRLPDRLEAVPEPLESVAASRRAGRASCSWPTATSWPTRPTTPSRPFPKMRWCASSPTKSARKAACRRTAACSSRSSRPS